MAIEIVDFAIKNGGSFHSKLLVYHLSVATWAIDWGPLFL